MSLDTNKSHAGNVQVSAQQLEPEPNSPNQARIVRWDHKKGYGFLQLGKEQVFLHRRDFVEFYKNPELGDRIRFTLGVDEKGRSCAQNAVHDSRVAGISIRSLFLFPFLVPLPLNAIAKFGPDLTFTLAYVALLNAFTYWVYARDKKGAQTGGRRIPEVHMHLLELFGGWPAAYFAQRKFHHKRSHGLYRIVYRTIILLWQLVAFEYLTGWQFSRRAINLLQSLSVKNLI